MRVEVKSGKYKQLTYQDGGRDLFTLHVSTQDHGSVSVTCHVEHDNQETKRALDGVASLLATMAAYVSPDTLCTAGMEESVRDAVDAVFNNLSGEGEKV